MSYNYRVYLDVCCLNRLYDDQGPHQIRLESEAVATILSYCQSGAWQLITSTAIDSEIEQIPDLTRKYQVKESLSLNKIKVIVTGHIIKRMIELTALNFKNYDALHLACAESNSDVFLTTDPYLLSQSMQRGNNLKIRVINPVIWLLIINSTPGNQDYTQQHHQWLNPGLFRSKCYDMYVNLESN